MGRAITITYNTVIDMQADSNLKSEMICETLGYNTVGDGLASKYRVYDKNDKTMNPNTDLELANNCFATPIKTDQYSESIASVVVDLTDIQNSIARNSEADAAFQNTINQRVTTLTNNVNNQNSNINSSISRINERISTSETNINNVRSELYDNVNNITDTMNDSMNDINERINSINSDISSLYGRDYGLTTKSSEINLIDECGIDIVGFSSGIKAVIVTQMPELVEYEEPIDEPTDPNSGDDTGNGDDTTGGNTENNEGDNTGEGNNDNTTNNEEETNTNDTPTDDSGDSNSDPVLGADGEPEGTDTGDEGTGSTGSDSGSSDPTNNESENQNTDGDSSTTDPEEDPVTDPSSGDTTGDETGGDGTGDTDPTDELIDEPVEDVTPYTIETENNIVTITFDLGSYYWLLPLDYSLINQAYPKEANYEILNQPRPVIKKDNISIKYISSSYNEETDEYTPEKLQIIVDRNVYPKVTYFL